MQTKNHTDFRSSGFPVLLQDRKDRHDPAHGYNTSHHREKNPLLYHMPLIVTAQIHDIGNCTGGHRSHKRGQTRCLDQDHQTYRIRISAKSGYNSGNPISNLNIGLHLALQGLGIQLLSGSILQMNETLLNSSQKLDFCILEHMACTRKCTAAYAPHEYSWWQHSAYFCDEYYTNPKISYKA